MNDSDKVSRLKEFYDKAFFKTTGSILDIKSNTLYFIKSTKYLKYIKEDIPNIHIIVPKEVIPVDEIKDNISYYTADNVQYVFGEVHNYIHNSMTYYSLSNIRSSTFVHDTAVLNAEGIHLYHTPDGNKKQLKHISHTNIGANTTVGANTIIHRGVLEPTIIGDYVTIGSLVSIGHNCYIDDHSVITPGCVLSGRVRIGKNCWIGVNSSFKHGVRICNNVVIGQHSNVRHNITRPGIYAGEPLRKISEYTEGWNF